MWPREAGLKGSRRIGRIQRVKALRTYYKNPNTCLWCNAVIKVRPKERVSSVRKRKFCNKSCAAKYNNKHRPRRKPKYEKTCPVCGKTIFCTWRARKFCSNECHWQYKRTKFIKKWLAGEVSGNDKYQGVRAYVRRHLFEISGGKCMKCGWAEKNPITGKVPLVVNHIDGDSFNTRPENLELICPNCDSLTPHYKALNRGNGRKWRRELRQKELEECRGCVIQ